MPRPRKRMRRWEAAWVPRFLTFSCHRRLGLLGTPPLRDAFARHLAAARAREGFRLLAWVVMPEHVHLILVPQPGGPPVADICRRLKGVFARSVLARWRERGAPILEGLAVGLDDSGRGRRLRFWQAGGGFDHNVRSEDSLEGQIAYCHQNPVERGLVGKPTDWAWSSARWYAGTDRRPAAAGGVEIDAPPPTLLREGYRLALAEGRTDLPFEPWRRQAEARAALSGGGDHACR